MSNVFDQADTRTMNDKIRRVYVPALLAEEPSPYITSDDSVTVYGLDHSGDGHAMAIGSQLIENGIGDTVTPTLYIASKGKVHAPRTEKRLERIERAAVDGRKVLFIVNRRLVTLPGGELCDPAFLYASRVERFKRETQTTPSGSYVVAVYPLEEEGEPELAMYTHEDVFRMRLLHAFEHGQLKASPIGDDDFDRQITQLLESAEGDIAHYLGEHGCIVELPDASYTAFAVGTRALNQGVQPTYVHVQDARDLGTTQQNPLKRLIEGRNTLVVPQPGAEQNGMEVFNKVYGARDVKSLSEFVSD